VRALNDTDTQTYSKSNDAPHSTQSNEVLKSAGTLSHSGGGGVGGSSWAAGLVPSDREDRKEKEGNEMHQGRTQSPSQSDNEIQSAAALRQGTGIDAPGGLTDEDIGIETSEVEDGDGDVNQKKAFISSAGESGGAAKGEVAAAVVPSSSASPSPSSPVH
jgi:hypothetical protein